MLSSTIVFVAALLGSAGATIQSLYGQCGGQGYTGPSTCTAGSFCSTQNAYYGQCTPSPVTTTDAAVQSLYGQCGGQGYTGPSSCSAGSFCSTQNQYYAQCTPGSGPGSTPATTTTLITTTTSTTVTGPSSTTTASVPSGVTYKSSFTMYGEGDSYGSPNCNTDTAACGFYDYPGYNAAVSQNLYGAGPGQGVGPACGTCWQLTPQTDSSGNALHGANTIIVKVNNLCPAQGNPLCSQNGLSGTNMYGANVNFDLCEDDGAAAALFGSSGVGLAVGTANQVSCSLYSGTQH